MTGVTDTFTTRADEAVFVKQVFVDQQLIHTVDSQNVNEPDTPGIFVSYHHLIMAAQKAKSSELLAHFIQIVKQTLTESRQMKSLVDKLKVNFDVFKNSAPIVDLFRMRVEWLHTQIENVPQHTYRMPNVRIHGHPDVEKFFNSDRRSLRYRSLDMVTLEKARAFALIYHGNKDEYSCTMLASGSGKSVNVQIEKTDDFYEQRLKAYEANVVFFKR